MNVLVLIGSTSTLGLAIARNNSEFSNIICIDRDENSDGVKINDAFRKDFCEMINYDKNNTYKIIYLISQKYYMDKIEDDINLNVLLPMIIYKSIYNKANCEFCYIGSQGDLHGSPHCSLYNSSKSYITKFLEGQIFLGDQSCKLTLIKPWIFRSKMYTHKSFLTVNIDKLSLKILSNKKKSGIYLFPRWTYFVVRILELILPKDIFYKILQKSSNK